MNDEERQRTMDFMLQQQAKFDAHIAELRESDKRADIRLTRLENILRGAIRTGLRERREWRERYAALVDAQVRTEDVLDSLAARQERMQESQERTQESLERMQEQTQESLRRTEEIVRRNSEDINRLAKIVERTSTERNGGSGGDRTGEDGH
jgi:hypothetical protein